MDEKEICEALSIDEKDVVNIYPYGSRVYGTDNENSDDDFIIVYKASMLPNGGFRANAISSEDRKIQAVCYSRGGFQDAINNYEIGALECLNIPEDMIIKKVWPFKIGRFENKQFVKKIITKASSSWYVSKGMMERGNIKKAKKGVWHALRILDFGVQIKQHGKIVDFTSANEIKMFIDDDENFKLKNYIGFRDGWMETLKNI